MSPQPTNPAERRTEERRKDFADDPNFGRGKLARVRSGADRRSPGGAGLDCAVVGDAGAWTVASVAREVARHAKLWVEEDAYVVSSALYDRLRAAVSVEDFEQLDVPSAPPHEQQNEPSSSPSRAPGDEQDYVEHIADFADALEDLFEMDGDGDGRDALGMAHEIVQRYELTFRPCTPGDEPAAPFALPVRVEQLADAFDDPPLHLWIVVQADDTTLTCVNTREQADYIADCINARRAAPPSTENPERSHELASDDS